MSFLDFARGPALAVALVIFVVGTLWHLVGVLRRPRLRDLSPPRETAPSNRTGALHAIVRGMWPRKEFGQAVRVRAFNGYVFHIGLVLVFLGYAPHIAFIHRITGLSWPALPDGFIYLAAGATILSLLLALASRLSTPVLRMISNLDDWITWGMTFLPMLTGMAVLSEPSAIILARDHVIYPGPLAVHLLALELLLIWFPFGKLMHAVLFVFSRGATGLRFSHRGVKV
jgi:nitrate reductase gamma subunit